MKHIIIVLSFIASFQASAQSGFFRPSYIGHLPDTHNIQVLVGDTVLKYGAWIGIDSLINIIGEVDVNTYTSGDSVCFVINETDTSCVEIGAVGGLDEDYVVFGRDDGTIEQSANLRFINNDSLVLDSALTINGVSGITPTTVKILKNGMIEIAGRTNNDNDTTHVHMRVDPIETDQGNVPWFESFGSTAFDGARRDQQHYQGFNLLPGGNRHDEDNTAIALVFENYFATGGQVYDEFQFRHYDSTGVERRMIDWRVNNSHSTAGLNDWFGSFTASEMTIRDPLNSNPLFRFRRDGTNGARFDMYASTTSQTSGMQFYVDLANNNAQINPQGLTTPILYSGFHRDAVNRLSISTLEGTAGAILGRETGSNLISSVGLTDGLELTSGNLGVDWQTLIDSIATNNPEDSVFSMGDLICIVTSELDTICGDTAFYDADLGIFCVVDEADTTCVTFTPEGGNTLYSGNGVLAGNRTVQMAGHYVWFRDGTTNYFQVDPSIDGSDPTVIIWNKSNTGAALSLSGVQNSSNDIFAHFNGVTSGETQNDYTFGVDVSEGALRFGKTNLFNEFWFSHWGYADSTVFEDVDRFQVFGDNTDNYIDFDPATSIDINVSGAESAGMLLGGGDGSLLLSSSTNFYQLGNNVPSGDAADSVLVIDPATHRIYRRHAGLFGGSGSGDPGVWYESGATPANAVTDEIYHTGDVHINDATMSGTARLNVTGTTGTGFLSSVTSGTSIAGFATSGVGVGSYTTSGGLLFDGAQTDASTNTIRPMSWYRRGSSGTPANGIGLSMDFSLETSTSSNTITSQIATTLSDVTHATRTSTISLWNSNSGTLEQQLTLLGTGQLQLNKYVPGAFSGASTDSVVTVDASGNFRVRHADHFGGGGSGFTQEEIEDFVGDMVTGNTETGIAVTYEDSDGTLDFVVTKPKHIKGATVQSPSATENISLFYTDHAITITRISDAVLGSSPTVDYNIQFAANRNEGSPTDVFASDRTASTEAGTTTTTFADATIPANQWVWLITSATSGTVNDFNVTIQYTED